MATPMTIRQEKFQALKAQYDDQAEIIGLACGGLMEFVERGELRVAELTAEFGAVSSPLKALEKQGVVRIEHRRRMRGFQVPSACRPPERLDAAKPPGTRSCRDPGGSRTAVRFTSTIPPISGTRGLLADLLRQPARPLCALRAHGRIASLPPDQPVRPECFT